MPSELASFLRQMRLSRQVSQAEAARLAGVGRVTLNRWEAGVQQPREVEIEALFAAFGATPEERRQLSALYQTASIRLRARDSLMQVGARRGIGSLPQGGDLLRALRLRRNLSQSEAASCSGVAERTVRRWELSEVQPSPAQLEALCNALGARPEECLALTEGELTLNVSLGSASLEELQHRSYLLHTSPQSGQHVKELEFLLLENQIWHFAAHSAAGREVLAEVHGYHAHYLDYCGRFAESGRYAERTLDTISDVKSLTDGQSLSILAAARSAVYGGSRTTAERGIKMLNYWINAPQGADYSAWMLSDLAKYTAQLGGAESSLALAQRAIIVAGDAINPIELPLRELDKAQILVWIGKARCALSLLEQINTGLYFGSHVQFRLLEVEAHLQLQNTATAHNCLQDAMNLIEDMVLPSFLPQVQKLARRL